MRHLIRNTTLAALCALMLGLATTANANVPGRPIDRPEGPPDPNPTMVGDPDAGHGLTIENLRALYLAFQLSNPRLQYLTPAVNFAKRAKPVRGTHQRARR